MGRGPPGHQTPKTESQASERKPSKGLSVSQPGDQSIQISQEIGRGDSVTMETANLEIRFGVIQLEIWRRSRKQRESNSCKSLRRQSLNSRTNPRIHPENLRENNHTSSRRF